MNPIDKIISFVELALKSAPSDRFQILEADSGYPLILDHTNRVRVLINVDYIRATRFDANTGDIRNDVEIQWEQLTLEQKRRLLELLDPVEDMDPAVEEEITEIFRGTFE